MPPRCGTGDAAESLENGSKGGGSSEDEAASREEEVPHEADDAQDADGAAELAAVESVFGAAASSWQRVNQEMQEALVAKVLDSAEQDFKELQRQFSQRLFKSSNAREAEAATVTELKAQYEDLKNQFEKVSTNSKVKRFETC